MNQEISWMKDDPLARGPPLSTNPHSCWRDGNRNSRTIGTLITPNNQVLQNKNIQDVTNS